MAHRDELRRENQKILLEGEESRKVTVKGNNE
jgi:hypothetical protein